MIRIDLIGPSGVGKSYLYNILKKSRSNFLKEWLTIKEAKRIIALKNTHLLIKYLSFNKIIDIKTIESFSGCYEEWNDFFSIYQKGLNNFEIGDSQFYNSLSKVLITTKIIRLLDENINKKVLFDHSLSQKIFFCTPHNSSDLNGNSMAKKYFNSMPAPQGLIALSAKPKTIMERVNQRYLKTNTHKSEHKTLSKIDLKKFVIQSLSWVEIAVESMERKKIPVLEIKSDNINETTILRVNQFIKEL